MTSDRPLSAAEAVWIMGRLAIRRQMNLWRSVRLARKRPREARRSGTPTKSGGRSLFAGFMFVVMLLNGVIVGSRGLLSLSATARNVSETSSRIVVSPFTAAKLAEADQALQHVKQLTDVAKRQRYEGMWSRYVDQLFASEVRWASYSEDEENARLVQMRAVFARRGAAGFTTSHIPVLGVSRETWPRVEPARLTFLRALSVLVLLWVPIAVFLALGTNNKDLGQVEWSFEWLYTFPVSARVLFASKLLSYAFLNPLLWCFFFPFVVLIYVAGGFAWAALPLGFVVMTYLAIVSGALTEVLEVALRKFLSLRQLKNMQALLTVVGTFSLLFFYAATLSRPFDDLLIRHAAAIPACVVWNPVSLPLILALPQATARQLGFGVIGMAAALFAIALSALIASEWLTQDGLVKAGGPYQSVSRSARRGSRRTWLKGVSAQEMTLLFRDRNLLVQVFVIPMLVPIYYLLVNSGMLTAVTGNFRHAAMAAFAVGAYSFLNGAMLLLSREDKTLWHLLSFPHSIISILLEKAAVWAAVGLAYGGVVLLLIAHFSPGMHVRSAGDVFLALYGIGLYAFIASGIGILATDLFETERRVRLRVDMVYLYMLLVAMYANTFYSLSVWTALSQLVLSTLLAFALWQKVKDLSPYFLDPTERPARTIGLADGMIAALAFFVAQGVMVILLPHSSTAPLAAQITIAYIMAGLIVGAVVLCVFWWQGIGDLWREIGLLPRAGSTSHAIQRSVIQGLFWGGAAAVVAFAYVHALGWLPQWQLWKQDAELTSFLNPASQPVWVCVLLIVAAPLFEEFLFRGLVFQGLRRTTGPALAVVGSAALFALVHPPIAVIPVFGLGIAAALGFESSGFLLTPILAHAVYNGSILLFSRV